MILTLDTSLRDLHIGLFSDDAIPVMIFSASAWVSWYDEVLTTSVLPLEPVQPRKRSSSVDKNAFFIPKSFSAYSHSQLI